MSANDKILMRKISSLKEYLASDGFTALKKVLKKMSPVDVIEEVKKSGITGRGGAGFPAGLKWDFCSKDPVTTRYIVCNADEGEPGTFKDRYLLESNPYAVIEGMIIAGFAISSNTGYIYIRGEFFEPARRFEAALKECYKNNYLGKKIAGSSLTFDIYLHPGAGAYICGEETALMESLEGKVGQPRSKPPFPVNVGIFGKPTVLNNVETFYNISLIILMSGKKYSEIGDASTPGPRLFSLSGNINKPGVYELDSSNTFEDLIYKSGGGIRNNRTLKCFFPGGSSSKLLLPGHISLKLENNAVKKAGSMLGSAAVIVMDETVNMVDVCLNLLQFYQHESCGKCTPCRDGTYYLIEMLERISQNEAVPKDLTNLEKLAGDVAAGSFCALGAGAVNCLLSSLEYFREDFAI